MKHYSHKVLRTQLEKTALKILNKLTSRYEYPYLKGVYSRGQTLLGLIESHLKPADNFLDIMCGYSPLASPLLKSGYKITGFDENRNAIKDLKNLYPKGTWVRASYDSFLTQLDEESQFSVFLLLGAFQLCSESAFISSVTKLLDKNQPRLFFLETNKSIEKAPTIEKPLVDESAIERSIHLKGYNAILKLLFDRGYKTLDVGEYDANLDQEWATIRIYALLEKKT